MEEELDNKYIFTTQILYLILDGITVYNLYLFYYVHDILDDTWSTLHVCRGHKH